jgi:hypothetical protein
MGSGDVRSYPVNLLPDPRLFPRDLFDPRWKDPRIAANVARQTYVRLTGDPAAFEAPPAGREALTGFSAKTTESRTFTFIPPLDVPERGTRLKAGAYNELHRRYAFGNKKPTLNFHAQVVCFGADSAGRIFLRATVGRFGGEDGNEVGLELALFASDQSAGGLRWTAAMDPAQDVEVVLLARSDDLARVFDRLSGARVSFHGEHTGAAKGSGPRSDGLDEAFSLFGGER